MNSSSSQVTAGWPVTFSSPCRSLTMAAAETSSFSFDDFPEDVQFCILSFLCPSDIANFTATSKRFGTICQNDSKLWFSLCDRRWSSATQITKWGNGQISYRLLYKTLNKWEHLIGFWRRCGQSQQKQITAKPPSLVFFEWGPSFLTGCNVSPSLDGNLGVTKTPFMFMSLSRDGQVMNYVDPDGQNMHLVPVNVDLIGNTHFSVEENLYFGYRSSSVSVNSKGAEDAEDASVCSAESGSPGTSPGMSEMYQYYANLMSPVAVKTMRKQRRREKLKKRWETEHFLKIDDCSPSPDKPLQGLWKGICEDKKLEFYLVAYDGAGISCRKLGDLSDRVTSCAPVFWTSNPTFIESPFSPQEEYVYDSRLHIHPPAEVDCVTRDEVVSRIMYINSSFDLVIPSLVETSANPWRVEGKVWQYRNGTFGYGFLRDNFIVVLKHIARNGRLLDTVELCSD